MIFPLIYTLLLGLLCAAFVEVAIYALFKMPERDDSPYENPQKPTKEENLRANAANRKFKVEFESHATIHYVLSLTGSTVFAILALKLAILPHTIANGILLGSVFTLGTGTCYGVSGGGRIAKLAVVTVSLIVALVLGWVEFGGQIH